MKRIKKWFYILTLQPCKAYGHDWKFAFNFGVPLGATWEQLDQLKAEGKAFPVHKCSRCGRYDHDTDGLDPLRGE